jgi:hypothetical protein
MNDDKNSQFFIGILKIISTAGIGNLTEACVKALLRISSPAAVHMALKFPGLSTQISIEGAKRYRDFLGEFLKRHGFESAAGVIKGSGFITVITETEEIVCIGTIRHFNNVLGFIGAVSPLPESGAVPLADGMSLAIPQIESRINAILRPGSPSSLELLGRRLIEDLSGIGVNAICIRPPSPAHIIISIARKEDKISACDVDDLPSEDKMGSGTILDKNEGELLWPGVNIETGIWLKDAQDRLMAFGFSDKKKLNKTAREKIDNRLESAEDGDVDYIIKSFEKLKANFKRMVNAERAAAVTETAVAVNHEINNPLTAILGNTQLLLMNKDKLSKETVAKLETIEKSAIQIREVTNQLMTIIEPVRKQYASGLEMIDLEKSKKKGDEEK